MSEPRKNHLNIEGGQIKEDEHVSSYKPIPESDTDFRSSKASLHKSKEKISADGAEEKLLDKEEEAKIVTRVDMADAKYVVGDHRNGDAKIELDANNRQFSGLTKEELMKYADDPFWVRLRWAMFILFWALWLCMLGGAIVIIVRAPKCALPTPRTWAEKGPLVDMGVKSYSEVETSLSQLKESHVAGVFTYACEDAYEALENKSLCLQQLRDFLSKAKEHGVKVIVDLKANSVPKTHRWFQLSANRSAGFENYFTWAVGSGFEGDDTDPTKNPRPTRPNNWVSKQDEEAWSWDDSRNQYYLHQISEQPDLNFTNPEVVDKFDAVVKAFMAAGAHGIRLHHARELVVDSSLADEKEAPNSRGADHKQHAYWRHERTSDQPQLDALLQRWSDTARATDYEAVFTVAEEEAARSELFLGARNTSALRPPSARVLRVRTADAAAADLNKRLPRWPLLQLVAEPESDSQAQVELGVFSVLLPAAPVLTADQLPETNDTDSSFSLSHVMELRQDLVIEHGRHEVQAVPERGQNATELLACIRWKASHLSYVGVYNPTAEPRRANLTGLAALAPPLAVQYVTLPTSQATNYTKNVAVPIDNVLVPARATVVLSFAKGASVDT